MKYDKPQLEWVDKTARNGFFELFWGDIPVGFIAETTGDNEFTRDFVYMMNTEIYGSQDTPLVRCNTLTEAKLGLENALKEIHADWFTAEM